MSQLSRQPNRFDIGKSRSLQGEERLGAAFVEMPTTAIFSITVLCVAISYPRECRSTPAIRSVCQNNLSNIWQSLQNYALQYGTLPPVYTTDADGNRVHSWRTLLRYIDHFELYQRRRLQEPWNSPYNRFLSDVNLELFHCPSDTGFKEGDTSYVAVVGPGTAWRPGQGISLRAIKDDPRYTILIVELKSSGIRWAEPRDLELKNLPPNITTEGLATYLSNHQGGFNALFADGSVRFVPDSVSWDDLQAMFTIAGGEVIDPSHL